jgi:hypothetical protein
MLGIVSCVADTSACFTVDNLHIDYAKDCVLCFTINTLHIGNAKDCVLCCVVDGQLARSHENPAQQLGALRV